MRLIKALLTTALGMGMISAGITAQVIWLGFCFGTLIIGLLLLFFARGILFAPFVFLVIGGWRTFKTGVQLFVPPMNLSLAIRKLSGMVGPQLSQIEEAGHPLIRDYKALEYVMALAQQSCQRSMNIEEGRKIFNRLYAGKARYPLDFNTVYDQSLKKIPPISSFSITPSFLSLRMNY